MFLIHCLSPSVLPEFDEIVYLGCITLVILPGVIAFAITPSHFFCTEKPLFRLVSFYFTTLNNKFFSMTSLEVKYNYLFRFFLYSVFNEHFF